MHMDMYVCIETGARLGLFVKRIVEFDEPRALMLAHDAHFAPAPSPLAAAPLQPVAERERLRACTKDTTISGVS